MRAWAGGPDPAACHEICVGLWGEEPGRTGGGQARPETHAHTPTHTQGNPYSDLQTCTETTQQSLPEYWHEKEMIYLFF